MAIVFDAFERSMHFKYLFKYLPTRSSFSAVSVSLLFPLLMLLLYNFCAKYFTPHNFLEIYILRALDFFSLFGAGHNTYIEGLRELRVLRQTHIYENGYWHRAMAESRDAVGSFWARSPFGICSFCFDSQAPKDEFLLPKLCMYSIGI